MYFHQSGKLDADTLEAYRICCNLYFENPTAVASSRETPGKTGETLIRAGQRHSSMEITFCISLLFRPIIDGQALPGRNATSWSSLTAPSIRPQSVASPV